MHYLWAVVNSETSYMRNSALFLVAPLALVTSYAQAANFTVSDIQFNGLTRVSADNLYPVLAVNTGEVANDTNIAASIKALYETGNFSDVKASQSGNKLVFDVVERPIIANVTYEGNCLPVICYLAQVLPSYLPRHSRFFCKRYHWGQCI